MDRISDSIIENPQRWGITVAVVSLAAVLGVIAWLDVRPAVQQWGALPGEVRELRAAVQTIPGQVAAQVVAGLQPEIRHGVDRLMDEVHGARKELGGQIEAARLEVLGPDGRFVALQGAVMQRLDEGLRIIDATSKDGVQPVLTAAAGAIGKVGAAADTYAALPGQVAQSPAWLALQPEITCRQPDGSGFGGCWHSRITALMGEAARVGGVFTQRFPAMADSATGIASDVRGFTHKYVDPHPMRASDYFKAAGKITLGLGVAGLRGGVF